MLTSNLLSLVSGSLVTAAVKPTPEEPLPDVETAKGAILSTKRSICDLAVEGSPINRTLISLDSQQKGKQGKGEKYEELETYPLM